MIWSLSSDKMFRRCQRQWFYKQVFGNANARKQMQRYEAYLLSKLQTLSALRGQAVDDALSEQLDPALNRGRLPRQQDLQAFARERFDEMLSYARAHPFSERLAKPAKLPAHFALLFDNEYGEGVGEEQYNQAYNEIVAAIENLFRLDDLLRTLSQAERVVAQRALTWKIGGNSVRTIPDFIAFYGEDAPLVLDWKVHYFGNADAARQLASYSLALARVDPHRDFPFSADGWPEPETRLVEVQLLKSEVREYEFSEAEYEDLEQWVASRTLETNLAVHGRKRSSDFLPEDFPTAHDGRQCSRCNFKRMRWRCDPV